MIILHTRALAEKNEEIKALKNQIEEVVKQKSEDTSLERPKNINEIYKDKTKLKLLVSNTGVYFR